MKKLAIFVTLSLAFLAVLVKTAYASQKCETQYGGNTVCVTTDIDINKKVFIPDAAKKVMNFAKGQDYVDNFLLTDKYKFAPNQEVIFKMTIENVSQKTFGKVEVRDFLPEDMILDSGSRDIKFNLDNFKPGDKKDFFVKAKIVSSDKLEPKNQDVVCPVNKAEVWSDGGTFQGDDTAQVCVAKKEKLAVLPKTGPEHIVIFLGSFIITGAAGTLLIKKTQNS